MSKPHSTNTLTDFNLPEGWATAPLKQLGADIPYPIGDGDHGQIKPSCYQSAGIPYIRVADIGWGNLIPSEMVYIPENVHEMNLKSELRPGDVVIAKTGATIGKCAIIPPDMQRANTTSSVGKVTVNKRLLLPEWLLYYILTNQFRTDMWAVSEKTAQPGFSNRNLESFIIPIAPMAEQKRIVAKVEELLERVNAARTRLAKLPAILKGFRKSVLSAACSGWLTETWREMHQDTVPATTLIKEERFQMMEPERGLPELPEGWTWAALGNYGRCSRGRFSVRPRNDPAYFGGTFPFIQIGDLPSEGGWIVSHKQTLNHKGFTVSKMFPKGAAVIAIVGATIGNTGLLAYDMCFPDSMVGIETETAVGNRYVELYLRYKKKPIRDASYSSGGQPNIKLEVLNPYPLALPSLEEQLEIVRRVDALFALADGIEAYVRAAIMRAEYLPKSILARAFRGELVPTEVELATKEGRNYESASVLLERIQERCTQQKPAKGRRGGKEMANRSIGRQLVRDRRQLDEVLHDQDEPLTPERLFDFAGFDQDSVDDFYEELRRLIQEGRIRENRPNKKDVTLEVVGI